MTMEAIDYLGRDARDLLNAQPFSSWSVIRSRTDDPAPEIRYVFTGHGFELLCDGFDRIRMLFLQRGDGESLIDVPFKMTRKQVLQRFGRPERSGDASRIPGIGPRGAWDRFTLPQGVLHFQYDLDCDEIDMITIMRHDAAPRR